MTHHTEGESLVVDHYELDLLQPHVSTCGDGSSKHLNGKGIVGQSADGPVADLHGFAQTVLDATPRYPWWVRYPWLFPKHNRFQAGWMISREGQDYKRT